MSKIVIVGGVAGGASCAARLRRLDENTEIIIFERGDYISYANCGLPYHIGNVIPEETELLLYTPELMKSRFAVDVRVKHEVTKIDREKKTVTVHHLTNDEVFEESYDLLVLSTGSTPLRPRIPGIESDLIKTVWTVNDATKIRGLVIQEDMNDVTVIGGGFIGLEVAENLSEAGMNVTIVEASNQVMAPLDEGMAAILHQEIRKNGVDLILSDGVDSFEEKDNKVIVKLQSGKEVVSDLVILSIGVRTNSELAKNAGLACNERGGIIVDEYMQTEDPSIYAIGDAIEVEDFVGKGKTMIPLAGPANKQGRIAADNIVNPKSSKYKGTQGSSIAKVFDLAAASTGWNEKTLQRNGLEKDKDYKVVMISQNSHAGYYPGAEPMMIKLIFSSDGTKIFGAQIVGKEGVDKRIDTIGVAMRLGASVQDLKELELSYAPPFNSAKDPVNMAGFVADNVLKGLTEIAEWNEIDTNKDAIVLDVREQGEYDAGHVENAVHIPLGQLRERINELEQYKDKDILVMCAVGVRAYNASRILKQNGFSKAKVYPGGMLYYRLIHTV